MVEPLADVSDLEKVWRPLSAAEKPRAEYYLGFASRRIRERWGDVDVRLAAGTLDRQSVSDVVVHMVLGVVDGAPVRNARSWSETRGPVSQSVTLEPGRSELLTIEDWMVRVFEVGSAGVGPRGSFPPSGGFDRVFRHKEGRY